VDRPPASVVTFLDADGFAAVTFLDADGFAAARQQVIA
jgi:hypothetical protein